MRFDWYSFAAQLAHGRRILELGAGDGQGSRLLADHGATRVLAIDPDTLAVKVADATNSRSNLEFREGSLTDLSWLPPGAFDLVLRLEPLEAEGKTFEVIDDLKRVLTADGFLLAAVTVRGAEAGTAAFESGLHSQFKNFVVWEALGDQVIEVLRSSRHIAASRQHSHRMAGSHHLLVLAADADLSGVSWPVSHVDASLPLDLIAAVGGPEPQDVQQLRHQLEIRNRISRAQQVEIDQFNSTQARLEHRVAALEAALGAYAAEYELIIQTRGWRFLVTTRALRRRIDTLLRRPASGRGPAAVKAGTAIHRRRTPDWDGQGVSFSANPDPLVSIVIPVHGKVGYTYLCLASIRRHTDGSLIEVIVVDDASTDRTPELLDRSEGIVPIRNSSNLGFVGSINAGIEVARGRYLMMLNNDAEVSRGWLTALLDAMTVDSSVGAVGAKLVYPDGTLQEAGGIIWNDGSGWNYGRGQNPAAPQFNFRRDVDYCSGAALMVRLDLLRAVGGLDRQFDPGFYEDTDLCFALRQRGHRVLYEPKSVVVHHEGTTFGTDAAPNELGHSKQAQYANSLKFQAKWTDELAKQFPPGAHLGLRGGRQSWDRSILVIDESMPMADRDSGSLRMTMIILLLRKMGHHVSLFTLNRQMVEPYSSDLQRAGVEVLHPPGSFDELSAGREDFYDLVLLSRPRPAADLMEPVRRLHPSAVLAYDSVDLHHLREDRERAFRSQSLVEDNPASRELEYMSSADIAIAVTEVEESLIKSLVPSATTFVLPNVHAEIPASQPDFDEREGLFFLGSYLHSPNLDAAVYLAEEIMPRIRKTVNAKLWIVGSDPPATIRALQSPDIEVTGHVLDLAPFFRRARVFVAPLRYGAGMKGKIGQAMSFGLPLVTTTIGAEGMGLVDGTHALIRDDPDEFAAAAVRLYTDHDLWRQVAASSRRHAEENWSPASMQRRLERLLKMTSEHAAGRASALESSSLSLA